jgi:diguanylate cyclase (GGDEF)-like protein
MQWPGTSLCIRDETRGICVQTLQQTHFSVGDTVDLVGFSEVDNSTSILTDAVFKKVASGAPVTAEPVAAEQALLNKHNSELVQIDGELIGRDLATSNTTLMLTSGKFIFTAVLPQNQAGRDATVWKNGSRLRLTGVCSIQFDPQLSVSEEGVTVPKSFKVLLRSPGDVVVLQRPSWWTPDHALVLLAMALTGTLLFLAWVVVLRKRLEEQTNLIRESEERFRHMALHDSLTGPASRALLQDRLNVGLQSARRHQTGLALLMLDIDKFKQINDAFGHQAGDEVLRVSASRLLQAVRQSDTVARVGGDEFVVLFHGLCDPLAAEALAGKVVEALADPIPLAGQAIPVSVSAGVCVACAGELDAEELMKGADAALYQAKAQGRNCYRVFRSI